MTKKIILGICLVIFVSFGFAQVKTDTATEDFDEYERNFDERTPTPKRTKTRTPIRTPRGKTPTPTPKPTPTPIKSVGKPGMKIWLERQISCDGEKPFLIVKPTTVFQTGDCVRVRFRLNFSGYLTIINLGTSGKNRTLFPEENQSNKLALKTDYYLPETGSWKFKGEPGNEQLVFIVSKSPMKKTNADDYDGSRSFGDENSDAVEINDKDIVPLTENEEVYILSDDTRLEKPLEFRMTIRHR